MRRKGAVNKPIQVKMKQKIVDESDGEEDELFDRKHRNMVPDNKRSNDNVSDQRVLRSNSSNKRVKVSSSDGQGKTGKVKVNGSSIRREVKETVEWDEMGVIEQRILLKKQIVEMIIKAGWTIEYKQRKSRDYKNVIYTDSDGRGFWSVTLAYKKLKERIDKGKGLKREISAFKPIPDEKLSSLLRGTTPGLEASANKNSAGKIDNQVSKKVTTKVGSVDGERSTRTTQILMERNSAGKSNINIMRKVTSEVRSVERETGSRTRQTLRGRGLGQESNEEGYELYEGKCCLLSWMIDLGTVPIGGKVRYRKGRTKTVERYGKIVKDGICCDCCNTKHTVQGFESHANSDLDNPYQNTYLESGKSLLQCVVDSWNKHVEVDSIGYVRVDVEGAADPNDDRCNICGDGGDLICCDSCPSTFHAKCLNINIPSGDWNCVYCSCKFCEITGESTSMSDGSEDLLSNLFTCHLCDEKFHVNCEKAAEGFHHEDPSFCGTDCQKIFEQLQVLLGVKSEPVEGFSHTILQHHEVSSEASSLDDDDISKVINNAKLAVAFTVMDECFVPFIDDLSGTNMTHSVIYNRGSNVRRLNYGGFYTIILEKDDDIIAVASIRIHGSQLAEMPFIGTRYAYRRQKMCTRLLTVIEKLLCSLGVEKLVIPAISQLKETWTKTFGFQPVKTWKRHEMKHMSMIVFPGTKMLEKPVIAIKTATSSVVKMVQEKRKLRDRSDVSQRNK